MKFDDLHKIFIKDFKTDRLADISKELGVTPQVVSNWKSRNHVPYKYVKKLRDLKRNISRPSNLPYDGIDLESINDSSFEIVEPFILSSVKMYRKLLNYKKIFFASVLMVIIMVTLYINILYEPLYVSVGVIIPSSQQKTSSSVNSIASQFGLGGASGGGGGILSPNVYPSIIHSYNFLNRILNKFHNTKKNKLINILFGADSTVVNWNNISRLNAVELLSSKIFVMSNKKTSIISLRVTTNDPSLSMEIAQNTIDQLGLTLKEYEKKQLKEKLDYITLRINEVSKELIVDEEKLKIFRETNRIRLLSPQLNLEENRLIREVDVQEEIFTTLKSEYELTQINLISRSNLILTIDKPRMPLIAINLSPTKFFILSFIVGVLLIVLAILSFDWYQENKKLLFTKM